MFKVSLYLSFIIAALPILTFSQNPAIGLNSVELRIINKIIQTDGIKSEPSYQNLSDAIKRFLSDRSVSLLILWPDGRLYYRSGRPTTGDIYLVTSAKVIAKDYKELFNFLKFEPLIHLINSVKSSNDQRYDYKIYTSAYNAIQEIENLNQRESFLALYGEVLTNLPNSVLLELRRSNPAVVKQGLIALSRANENQIENIKRNNYEIAEISGDENWWHSAQEEVFNIGIEEHEAIKRIELELELGLGFNGYIKTSNATNTNKNILELIEKGEISFFVGEEGTSNIMKISENDFKRLVKQNNDSEIDN